MTTEEILTAIGLIGLGGLLKSGFDFFISTRKQKQEAKQTFKELRYKAIILFCYALVNYDKEKMMLVINRPDIDSIERLKNEIQTEFVNMSLFASDNVIVKMRAFLNHQNSQTLNSLIIAMRKDLYGIKTSLKESTFDFLS